MIEAHKLGFEILFDEGGAVSERFGLRHTLPPEVREIYSTFGIDLPASNGEPSWTLPLPARYVVNRDGVIVRAAVNADYTRRPEAEDSLEALASP